MFTVKQAAEMSGVGVQPIRNLIATGVIRPIRHGTSGAGKGHRLSLVQVLAIVAFARYREAGAGPERASGVLRFLAKLSQEKLEANFADGRTFPVPESLLHQAAQEEGVELPSRIEGMLVEPPSPPTPQAAELFRRLDLVALWDELKQKAEGLGVPARSTRRELKHS